MIRSAKTAVLALALAGSTLALAGPAHAVTDFANCTAMHKVYPAGVAKSKAAATKQYNSGNKRPVVKPLVYAANNESDADHDGTACEVPR